jgi:hypothetical protein
MREKDLESFASTGVKSPLIAMKTIYRPLSGLRKFPTIIAIHLNDLPATSPHGSYSEHDARNLGFATDPNTTRGTATAHRTHVATSHATDRIIAAASLGTMTE